MDKSARFWDRIAERYSKRPISDEAAYQKKLQVTREYLRPDMELLEIGCGKGEFLHLLCEGGRNRGIGIDPAYVERERPLDCAGSFKAEALGISLFERIDSNDPTGLIGLPLIWLAGVLRHLGFEIP